ncbi:MAG: hypothetical protein AAGK78_01065 [Planctomycetota bacterium]
MHFEDHTRTEVIGGDASLGVIDPDGWLRLRVSFDGVEPARGNTEARARLLVERFEDGHDDEPDYDQWPATLHRMAAGQQVRVELETLGVTVQLSVSPDPLETETGELEVHGVAPEDWHWRPVERTRPPEQLGG